MLKYYISLFSGIIIAAAAQMLLKSSAKQKHKNVICEYLNFKVISGYVLMFVSMLLNIYALTVLSYKTAPAAETLGFVLVTVFGAVIFKEKLTKKRIIGAVLIISGIIIFNI